MATQEATVYLTGNGWQSCLWVDVCVCELEQMADAETDAENKCALAQYQEQATR